MKISLVQCGRNAIVGRGAFSPSGTHIAVCSGPRDSLELLTSEGKSRWFTRLPTVSDCRQVAFANVGGQEQLLWARMRDSSLQRFDPNARRMLAPLPLASDYEPLALVVCGNKAAVGDAHGYVTILDLQAGKRIFCRHMSEGSIYALAFGNSGNTLHIATSTHIQCTLDVETGEAERIHGETNWDCFSLAAHPTKPGVAMSGVGTRIWLVDMPFKLDCEDGTAGDGFPVAEWDLDGGGFADKFSLRQRIYVPGVEAERCSWIDAEVGEDVNQLIMLPDWHLIALGDHATAIYQLNPFRLVEQVNYRTAEYSRVFAVHKAENLLKLALRS